MSQTRYLESPLFDGVSRQRAGRASRALWCSRPPRICARISTLGFGGPVPPSRAPEPQRAALAREVRARGSTGCCRSLELDQHLGGLAGRAGERERRRARALRAQAQIEIGIAEIRKILARWIYCWLSCPACGL